MMDLIQEIAQYHKVSFPTSEAASAASEALQDLVTSTPATLVTMVGPNRVVMWEEAVIDPQMRTLYVSPGALTLLQKLVSVPPSVTVPALSLPEGRTLILGDDRDWDWTGGRPSGRAG